MSFGKKVVVFAPLFNRLPTFGYGAIEKLTLERVKSLNQAGFRVQFVAPIEDLDFTDEVINIDRVFKYPSTFFSKMFWLVNLNWTKYMHTFISLKKEIWDAPILSDAGAMDPLNNYFLASNFGSDRLVFFLHGNYYITNGVGKYLFLPFDRVTNMSKRITFAPLNLSLFNYMGSHGYRVKYLPSGIDFPKIDQVIEVPEEYSVFIGTMNKYKAPHLAIRLAKKIGIKLILIGPISDANYFDEFIKPYLDENITYLGEIKRSYLNEILRHSKCLFFTSTWNEPQGLVILEALSYGVPVLALHPGLFSGSYDMIEQGETGYIGTFDEVVSQSNKILSLDRRTVQLHASSKWSWENIIEKFYGPVIKEMQDNLSGGG